MGFTDVIGYGYFILLVAFVVYKMVRAIRIVPAQQVYVIERLGKYSRTLGAGFHALTPFMDRVAYILSLKEEAIDVPAQICVTRDNVQVQVDGLIYLRVMSPEKAAYNISDYRYAAIQLSQTTMRSVFGHMDLDKTFEEREAINGRIVEVVDQASDYWGVDVLRYEIQNITPSKQILNAMEKQMTAERDKRAVIALSEGEMTSQINRSQGSKQELINASEGEKMKWINEAEGKAAEIRSVAVATATGIRKIASSLQMAGGMEAMRLRLAEDYLARLQGLAKKETNLILPLNLADLDDVLQGLNSIVGDTKKK